MKVLSEKHLELSQTIDSLSGYTRMEKRCRRCDICRSMENKNRLFLLEGWDTQENLMTHLKSEHFKVLRGAMKLLEEPYEWGLHTDYQPSGMERFQRGADFLAGLLLPENHHLKINSPTFKPKSYRRNTMKTSTKDQAEGKFHNIKGKLKEAAGKLSDNPELEAEGTGEKIAGKVQEKIGQFKRVLEK